MTEVEGNAEISRSFGSLQQIRVRAWESGKMLASSKGKNVQVGLVAL
jgi:hypothetical protein